MAMMVDPLSVELYEQGIITRAADRGYRLARAETDTGQLVWEWRLNENARPQFLTRRLAINWMADFIAAPGGPRA